MPGPDGKRFLMLEIDWSLLSEVLLLAGLCTFMYVEGQGGYMGMMLGLMNEVAGYHLIGVGSRVQG